MGTVPIIKAKERARHLLIAAAAVLGGISIDVLSIGEISYPALSVRAFWVALLLGAALFIQHFKVGFAFSSVVMGLASCVALALLIPLTGGTSGVNFAILLTFPLLTAVIAAGDVPPTIAVSVAVLLLVGWLTVDTDLTTLEVGSWHVSAFIVGSLAIFGSVRWRRQRQQEIDTELERAALALDLEFSDARRRDLASMADLQRLATLGELSVSVAHEIRNPLTPLLVNLEILRDSVTDAADAEVVREAIDAGKLLRTIVSDLNAAAQKPVRGQTYSCHVSTAWDSALRLARRRLRGVEIEANLGADLPAAQIEHERLIQIFVNLIINAGDAMNEAEVMVPRLTVEATGLSSGVMEIAIEDNGPGVAATQRSKVFEAFVTSKAAGQGTGLGLAICRRNIEAAGGTIQVEEGAHGGARFVLQVPLVREPGETQLKLVSAGHGQDEGGDDEDRRAINAPKSGNRDLG